MAEDYLDDYWKWEKYAYEQRYGKGSWDTGEETSEKRYIGFQEFKDHFQEQ